MSLTISHIEKSKPDDDIHKIIIKIILIFTPYILNPFLSIQSVIFFPNLQKKL